MVNTRIPEINELKSLNIKATDNIKYLIISGYGLLILLTSFMFNSPLDIFSGMIEIIRHPGILVSDYIAVGNAGSAFFNSGLLMMISILISRLNKIQMNGTIIAAVFTVGGFAFFGKNFYNIWAIMLGVFIYSKVIKEPFRKFILVALFGTALSPLISQISYGFDLSPPMGLFLGNVIGVCAGFILSPLANHAVKFHLGFNIYNIGFTSGIIGTVFMSLFRAFGKDNPQLIITSQGYTKFLGIYLIIMFLSMIFIGFIFNEFSFKGYKRIIEHSGRLVTDFVAINGFGLSFINMGLLGIFSTVYIIILGGEINGPIIGGIFTIVGFAAFGKHLRNVLPIFIGVYLASLIQIWNTNDSSPLLAALFGTTLAPIAGQFGWKAGITAGFIHMAIVMNVGYLHGGMNLYNNGFSGGIVAAVMVPLIYALRKEKHVDE